MEGLAEHHPVMVSTVLEMLCPIEPEIILDCTVGLGGHAQALLENSPPNTRLIGLDVDESNLNLAKQRLEKFASRVKLFRANFIEAKRILAENKISKVNAVLADLGIASSQLDDPQRGLGFSHDGPLDMRMDSRLEWTAADMVNDLDGEELANLIYNYGEDRYSRRIARAIIYAREKKPIERTSELALIVARAYPRPTKRSRRGVHPATRTFQALRIAVNAELDNLQTLLGDLPLLTADGARACIISFHSLEDRLVKHAFAALKRSGTARVITKKPLVPEPDEIAINRRSRSAKLRCMEKCEKNISDVDTAEKYCKEP